MVLERGGQGGGGRVLETEEVLEKGWRREGGGEREGRRGRNDRWLYVHLYLGSSVTGLP